LITFINNTQISKGKSLEKSFLDALVICSEIVQNEPMLQNDPEEQILYATLEGIWNSGSNIDIDVHIDNLIGVLQSDNSLTRKLGWARCEAFANRLNAYMKAYRDYYKT
jgi:flagellar biosynthesis/type III secretory pathway protein FliH